MKIKDAVCPNTEIDKTGNTNIYHWVENKNYEKLEKCLKHFSSSSALPKDEKGFTPFYYAAMSGDEKLLALFREKELAKWGKHDLFNTIVREDYRGLQLLLKQSVKYDAVNGLGQTALDCALIHHNIEAAKLLRSYGATSNLSEKEILKWQKNEKTTANTCHTQFKMRVSLTNNGPCLEIFEMSGNKRHLKVTPWQGKFGQEITHDWKFLVKSQSCFIYLANQQGSAPDALYELQQCGTLILHYANLPQSRIFVESFAGFEIKSLAAILDLQVNALSFSTHKESKLIKMANLSLQAKNAHFAGTLDCKQVLMNIENDFDNQGEMLIADLAIKAQNLKQSGKIMIANQYDIEVLSRFQNKGEWTVAKSGKVKAHSVELSQNSVLVAQNGEVKLFAQSNIDNFGAIIADYIDLEALKINHYQGSLLKGLSCQNRALQVNNAGFILQGQKNSLSAIDWALNIVHAGVNLAQLASLIPLPMTTQLRAYLLVAKSLYRGADLLHKIGQGKGDEILTSEWATFLLDNVIPSIAAFSSGQEKAQLLVNTLYHFYGAFNSEDKFIHKSLSVIQALMQTASFCVADKSWLEEASNMVKCARYALKLGDVAGQAFSAWQSDDPMEMDNTIMNIKTLAEGLFREMLYALPPSLLLENKMLINPRDIALFVLNKGHKSELFFQSIVYGALHLAKRQGLLGAGSDFNDLHFLVQLYFRKQAWRNLFRAYQTNRLSSSQVIKEAIQGLIVVLNYSAQKQMTLKNNEPQLQALASELESGKVIEGPLQEELPEKQQEEVPHTENLNPESLEVNEKKILTPEETEEINKKNLEPHQIEVPDYVKATLTLDVASMIETSLSATPQRASETNLLKLACDALLDLQRAVNGEFAANGHYTAFVGALHNEGVLECTGSVLVSPDLNFTNNNALRAGKGFAVYGNRFADTFFRNLESGTITAQEAVYFTCLDLVENQGFISSGDKVLATAVRIVKNYQEGQLIAKEDVDILAESLAYNAGMISGKNVNFQGRAQKAQNEGGIRALNKIKLMSQKLVELSQSGYFEAERVALEGAEVVKEGGINARLVQVAGFETAMPEQITWKGNKLDAINALVLKAIQPIKFSEDAFNQVKLTDLTLAPNTLLKDLKISADFANILQLHLEPKNENISLEDLPKFSANGTLIADAPGRILNAANNLSSSYSNALRFIGEVFDYSNKNTIFDKPLSLDVKKIVGEGAKSRLKLKEGAFLQAESLLNQGNLYSDDMIHWNIKERLDNQAQLEHYTQHFMHSLRNPIYETCLSTKIAEGSGEIYAAGNKGYIGKMNQLAGKFLSGDKGDLVFYGSGEQEALLITQGVKSTEVTHDKGRGWYSLPTWVNCKIGSKGQSFFIGKAPFIAKGLDFWADKGGYLNSKEEISLETMQRLYEIPETQSLKKNNKLDAVIVPYSIKTALVKNHISSDNGPITLVSQKKGIDLTNTILSAKNNINFIAKDKVTIKSIQAYELQNINNISHSLTLEGKVHSSYLFSGGELVVRANELELGAVNGVLAAADIVAHKTTLSGLAETFDNKTVHTTFKLHVDGLDNLLNVLDGHNAKAVFKSIVQSCGWDQDELEALINVDRAAEIPLPLLNVARNAWNLTAFVAHVCKEFGETPQDFVGAFTDQMGITFSENGQRFFNPKFGFDFKKTTTKTHREKMVSTSLYVGGTFRLVGGELHILDGSEVDAAHLRIFLSEGIKATKGVDIYSYSEETNKISPRISLVDLTDVSLGYQREFSQQTTERAHLAKLHGRESVDIDLGKEQEGELRISGDKGGRVRVPKASFTSAQNSDTSVEKKTKVTLSTDLAAGWDKDTHTQKNTSTEKAGIFLPLGEVAVDSLHLADGSKVEANSLTRHDGQAGLPEVTGTAGSDLQQNKKQSLFVKSKVMSMEKHYDDKVTLQLPTILTNNVKSDDLPGINTSAANENQIVRDKKGGYAYSALKPNLEKLGQEIADIKQMMNKSMHWMFATKPAKNDPVIDVPDTLNSVPNSAENTQLPPILKPKTQNPKAQKPTKRVSFEEALGAEKKEKDLPLAQMASRERPSAWNLAWRAFNDVRSPEVIAWQEKNRASIPEGVIRLVDGVTQERQDINAFIKSIKDKVNDPTLKSMIPDTIEEGVMELIFNESSKIFKYKMKDIVKKWPNKSNKETDIKKPKETYEKNQNPTEIKSQKLK